MINGLHVVIVFTKEDGKRQPDGQMGKQSDIWTSGTLKSSTNKCWQDAKYCFQEHKS